MSGFGHVRRLGLAISIGMASVACDGCRRDHPFTPFVVTSAGTGAVTSTAVNVEVARPHDAGKFEIRLAEGEKLPENSRKFSLGPRQPEAPTSMTVDSVLRADWNADGNVDAVALMHANPGEPGPVGSVYFYDGGGDARKLLDLPGWLPSGPDCGWDTHLRQVGVHAASVDVHMHCRTSMPPRTPTRFLAILSPYRPRPLVIGWRFAEPAPGETFDAVARLEDRDGDGADDVTLSVSLGQSSGGELVRGEFVWLDRAAGPSQASGQLLASLEPSISSFDKKAAHGKTAAEALSGIDLVWRWLGSACSESGTPRLFSLDGGPIGCDSLRAVVSRLTSIEIRGALAQNDVLRAAFAASKSRGAFGTSQPNQELSRLTKPIHKACTIPETISVTRTEIRPVSVQPGPHYSPLQFQSDGILLVMTTKGVIRVQADGQEQPEDADAAAPASWPLAVISPDGRSWEGLIPSCDRSELSLVSKSSAGLLLTPDLTELVSPRPGVCAGKTSLNWHVSPIRFDDGKPPMALVEGACIAAENAGACSKPTQLGKPKPGSSLAPNGHFLVAVTGVGVFVLGGAKPELWESPDIGNLELLADCVVSNDGGRVGCTRAGHVVLLSKSSAKGASPSAKPAN